MSIDELKALFENGDKPTAADYGSLIDAIFEGKGVSQSDLEAVKTVLQTAIDTVKTDFESELTTAKNSITALADRVTALENPTK
ncbi:hypothetical protein [Lactococcus petauri]|uniref:hypothetical protein n=1 Tax=Lactococcus petauri TaxID=1940789 RepID=UPI0021D4F65E|nr:hypothetical protein [Lactococcus petauri]MCU7363644.1 hypothetical protein [Lactococcus petauri]MDA3734912.1 hypothetical protein [Lactococcus petauri]MDC7842334.1 hypothetical protein [Lactococcus petauri]